ncbi:MAG: hypothetical protein KatS3mg035_1338 [Bacteroidia bacterium]|nr:MAG: hypothetical protein KatS3mg035_1338 [Bacteroidia bacterium]
MLRYIKILGLGLVGLYACSHSSAERDLQGRWLINDYRVKVPQPKFEQDRMQEEIEKMKKNSYFIFYENHEYEVNLNGNIEKGKWRLIPENQQLATQKEHSDKEILLQIDTLNAKTFVFSRTQDSITTQVRLIKK